MYVENTFNDYSTWLNSGFLKRNSGGYTPPELQTWYDTIENNHKELRNLIQAKKIQKIYKLESLQRPIDIEAPDVKGIIDRLEILMPSLYRDIGISREDFVLPLKDSGNHNAVRISKEIARYARDLFYHSNSIVLEIEKLLSVLGENWAKGKTNSCELEITLSTNAKAFTLLGHYGPDDNSCFRQGSTSPYDKYIFAQSPNTFVITVSKFDEKKNKHRNIARSLGWYNKYFYLRNYYFSPGFQEGDFLALIEKFFGEILNDKVVIKNDLGDLNKTEYGNWRFYQNNYGNWAIGKNPQAGTLTLNLHNILCFACPKCKREYKDKRYFTNIDDTNVCSYCSELANVCEITGIRTFKPLYELTDIRGDIFNVHESVLKDYKRCEECNKHSTVLNEIDGKHICQECFVINYSHCEIGDHFVRDEEILDIGDITCCKNHKKNLENSEMIYDILAEIE